MKELIEHLRGAEANFTRIEAADAIERLENELTEATLRIENDKLEIAKLRGELALWVNPDRSVIREMAALVAERDVLKKDAEIGRVAMRFVDRAGDYCDVDPAERICDEFYKEISEAVMKGRAK